MRDSFEKKDSMSGYRFADFDAEKQSALAEAMQHARERAETLVAASKAGLGPVRRVRMGDIETHTDGSSDRCSEPEEDHRNQHHGALRAALSESARGCAGSGARYRLSAWSLLTEEEREVRASQATRVPSHGFSPKSGGQTGGDRVAAFTPPSSKLDGCADAAACCRTQLESSVALRRVGDVLNVSTGNEMQLRGDDHGLPIPKDHWLIGAFVAV